MNAATTNEVAAVEQADVAPVAIVSILSGLLAGEAKVVAAKAAAKDASDSQADGWKAAGAYYRAKYGTLDAMMSKVAEGEVKADIVAALPADIKAARAKREAGTLLTARQVAESDLSKIKREAALRELDLANRYMGYQTIYFARLCEYAFPVTKTPLTKYKEALETAFSRVEKLGKAIPAGLTPDDISAAKAALQKLGAKVGAKMEAKATAN